MSTRFHFEGIGRDGRELIIDACNVGGEYYEVMAMEPSGEEYASARVSSSVEARKAFLEFLRRFVVGFQIRKNEEFGSLEIFFDCKPADSVRDVLKSMRFRWNGRRGCWYGFAEFDELFYALCNACYGRSWGVFPLSYMDEVIDVLCDAPFSSDVPPVPSADGAKEKPAKKTAKKSAPVLAPLFDRCDVSGIPDHNPDNVIIDMKTIAADVRKHLKARFPECKFSVRSHWATHEQAIDAYITAAPYGFVDSYDPRWDDMRSKPGEELSAVLAYCRAYLNSWNYDRSDSMSDYFDVCFYGDFGVNFYDFTFTEPSAEIQADIRAFHATKLAKEEAETAAFLARQEAGAKAAAEYATKEAADVAAIVAGAVVEDIPEEKQLCYYGLTGGHGKECSLDELKQHIGTTTRAAIVSRSVFFDSPTFSLFCGYFLADFDFIAGKGGSRTFDSRVTDDNFHQLTQDQFASVEWFSADCVAVYCDGVLKLVIDPQGCDYARYVYLVPENPEPVPASELEAEAAAAVADPFYFPAPLSEQAAGLAAGDTITVLTVDPWIMTAEHITGTLISADALPYAQYRDALRLTIRRGRKTLTLWIYGDHETAVYSGILPDVPHGLKYEDVPGAANMQRLRFSGADVRRYMIDCVKHYASLGHTPVVDNIPR